MTARRTARSARGPPQPTQDRLFHPLDCAPSLPTSERAARCFQVPDQEHFEA